jgi:hypothetical protein
LKDASLDLEKYCQNRPLSKSFRVRELQLRAHLLDEGMKLTWLMTGECNKRFHGRGVQLLDRRARVLCSFADLDAEEALDLVALYLAKLEAKQRQRLAPRRNRLNLDACRRWFVEVFRHVFRR